MKITSIETFIVDGGYRPWTFVKVETDEGVTGYGECSDGRAPAGVVGTIESLAPVLIGQDPRAFEMRFWDMLRRVRQSPGGIAAKAIAGIDCALVDIKAKALGISVVELFGGPTRDRTRLYWSHCGTTRAMWSDLVGTPPLRSMQDIADLGREVVSRGFTALKTNIVMPGDPAEVFFGGFGGGLGTTDQYVTRPLLRHIEALIGTFRDAVGPDVDINLDLNFNFKPESVMRIAKVLEQFDLLWLEVDMYDPDAILQIKQSTSTKDMHRREPLLHAGVHPVLSEARRRHLHDRRAVERLQPVEEGGRPCRGLPAERRPSQLLQPPGQLHQRQPMRRAAQRPHHGDRRRRRTVEERPGDGPARDSRRPHHDPDRAGLGDRPERGGGARARLAAQELLRRLPHREPTSTRKGALMEQRALGDSGLFTSAIGFGTWEMSTTMYGHIDVGEASAAVNAAIDHGITLFDTAESYGPYHSEVLLAKALGNRRKDIVLVTKVGLVYDESGKTVGCNSKHDNVIQSAEGCLRRLDTDYLDLLLIHWPDHDTPFEEPVRALNRLKDEGKIRHYGVSNFTPEMMDECERHGRLAANQVGYHMFDRRMESRVLPYCLDKDIGFMAYGTLGFGLLAGAFTPDTSFEEGDWRKVGNAFGLPLFFKEEFAKELKVVERLKSIARRYEKSVAQLAIAWTIGHAAVSVGLVGMRNERELKENVAATEWKLDAEVREEVDAIFAEEDVPTHINTDQV